MFGWANLGNWSLFAKVLSDYWIIILFLCFTYRFSHVLGTVSQCCGGIHSVVSHVGIQVSSIKNDSLTYYVLLILLRHYVECLAAVDAIGQGLSGWMVWFFGLPFVMRSNSFLSRLIKLIKSFNHSLDMMLNCNATSKTRAETRGVTAFWNGIHGLVRTPLNTEVSHFWTDNTQLQRHKTMRRFTIDKITDRKYVWEVGMMKDTWLGHYQSDYAESLKRPLRTAGITSW